MSGQKRVLLSAFSCSPLRGSEPGVGWNWALELAKQGHDVTVLTRPDLRAEIEQGVGALGQLPNLAFVFVEVARGLDYKRLGLLAGYAYVWLWQLFALRAAQRLHRARAFDVVHHITFGSIRSPSFMGALGVPFIFGPLAGGESTPHLLRRHFPLRARFADRLRDLSNALVRLDPAMRSAFARAERILLKTPDSMRLVPARYRHKCGLAREIGIEPSVYVAASRSFDAGALRFLFIGRLFYFKGMGLGLRAFAAALARRPGLRLTMVGNGPEGASWRALGEALGVGEAVTWLGALPKHELGRIYDDHDVFLFPSLRDSSGTVIYEAAAHGLPVLCLDMAGPGLLVEGSFGVKVPAYGRSEAQVVEDLAAAMVALADDPARFARLEQGARQWASGQTWASRIGAVYGEEVQEHA